MSVRTRSASSGHARSRLVLTLFLALAVLASSAGADVVRILDDPVQAGFARIDLIQQAKTSIDIEYYAIHPGIAADTFPGLLLEAADRGVRVTSGKRAYRSAPGPG